MKQLRITIYVVSFIGLIFSLNVLRYAVVFPGDSGLAFETADETGLLLFLKRMINEFLSTPTDLTSDYHGILFHLHAFGGVFYLILTPLVLLSYRATGSQRWYFAIAASLNLTLAAAIALWPIHFLVNVHSEYDVSFFIVLTIESIWLLFWALSAANAFKGNSHSHIRYLSIHYALSLGAVFYRIVYIALANFGEDNLVYLDRENLVMRYHTAWFIALVLGVLLSKLFVYRFRRLTKPQQ